MDAPESALTDMIATLNEQAKGLPAGIEYIRLCRYMPAAAIVLAVDAKGRLHALAAEEVIDRLPRVTAQDVPLAALRGVPVVQ